MSEPLQVRVSREGKEIGTYPVQDAIRLLVYGTLRETDHYWHDGMAEWAPLVRLQASEARRQLEERALQQKQDEERKAAELAKKRREEAEQLRQEQAKSKEKEDNAVTEATRVRMEKRKENFFTCNCCKDTFEKPTDSRGLFWRGSGTVLGGLFVGLIAFSIVGAVRGEPPFLIILGFMVVSVLSILWGAILILSSGLRSPFCPGCHSTNYSRPKQGERAVFD
jgi:hypothetical protein